MKTFLFFVTTLLFTTLLSAQEDGLTNITPESAAAKMKAGNYEDALIEYLHLLNTDNKNGAYNYNVGVCYLNSNVNKAKAVPYLEIATRKEKSDPNSKYLLGRAYQYANRFDDAMATFKQFKIEAKGSIFNLADADLQIQHCINAKELMKYPIGVVFQNLGSTINSEYKDYYPFVTENESFIVFNSNRPEKNAQKLENGDYANSIFISKVTNGNYEKATIIGEPISTGNNGMEVIGLNANGDVMLLYVSESAGKGNIYTSKKDAKGNFTKPEKLDAKINSGGDEIAAAISNDGNTIYFASSRKDGFGGTDIYVCKKVGKKWLEPQNAGSEINTPYDEDFPNLSPDGKTLYFSSKGHSSMGGYDIFKSTITEPNSTFSRPKNIGYPINTTDDDMNFRISKNGKYGYFASAKAGGNGDYDIYRVSFDDVEDDYSVVIGEIKATDNSTVNYSDVFISVNNNITNEIVGNYLPNPTTGRFIVILPTGKYQMTIETPGYKTITKTIEVLDKSSYQAEINLNIELTK